MNNHPYKLKPTEIIRSEIQKNSWYVYVCFYTFNLDFRAYCDAQPI